MICCLCTQSSTRGMERPRHLLLTSNSQLLANSLFYDSPCPSTSSHAHEQQVELTAGPASVSTQPHAASSSTNTSPCAASPHASVCYQHGVGTRELSRGPLHGPRSTLAQSSFTPTAPAGSHSARSWSKVHLSFYCKVPFAFLATSLLLAHLSLVPTAAARPEPCLHSSATPTVQRQLIKPLQQQAPASSAKATPIAMTAQAAQAGQADFGFNQAMGVDSSTGPQQLAGCLNEGYEPRNMSWEQALNDYLAALKAVQIWWSPAPESPNPVTLVTQLSHDRLPQLEAQCASWGGRLSAVVYLSVPASPKADDMPKAQSPPPGPSDHWLIDQLGGPSKVKKQQQGKQEHTFMAQLVVSIRKMVKTRGAARRRTAEVDSWAGGEAAERLIAEAVQAISALHAKAEARLVQLSAATGEAGGSLRGTGCALDVMLVVEEVASIASAHMHYPVNALRNLARLQARTPLVALMDVDMLVSAKLVTWLERADHAAVMVKNCEKGTAYVLPAFETYGTNMSVAAHTADILITTNKQALARAVVDGLAGPFDAHRFSHGHAPTNYKAWFMTNEAYEVDYEFRFEPWVIVHRLLAPWYDARFRGYGFNKIEHTAHLNATGFKFVVHPTGFIVHRAHEVARTRSQFMSDLKTLHKAQEQRHLQQQQPPSQGHVFIHKMPKWKQEQRQQQQHQAIPVHQQGGSAHTDTNTTLYGHMKALMDSVQRLLQQASFVPVVDAATARCVRTLPWWSASTGAPAAPGSTAVQSDTSAVQSSTSLGQSGTGTLESGTFGPAGSVDASASQDTPSPSAPHRSQWPQVGAALIHSSSAVLSSVAHTVMDLGSKAGAQLAQHAAAGSDWEAGLGKGNEVIQNIGEYFWGRAQGRPLKPLSGLRVGW